MKRNLGNRRGIVSSLLLLGAALCAIAGAVAWFYYSSDTTSGPNLNLMMATVERGDFVAKVLDQGEIQSSDNVEIRCEVRARNGQLTVISLATEGTRVGEGDFLVRLDSTAFEQELETQRIAVANAKAAVIQADANLKTAETTLEEYIKGTYNSLKKDLENQILDAEGLIVTSKQEYEQSKELYEYSVQLQAKGFITEQQLDSDELAVARSELAVQRNVNQLDMLKQNLTVLQDYTLKKEKIQLESDIEAARVKLESEKDALRVQERQLAEVQEMIKKCEIVVPEGISGQVVYAKEQRGRGGDEWVLEEGANVRESQVLIRLPDTQKMEVKALINEQNITQIETGMPATIKVDALSDKTLKGIVTKVNQYAESSGWGGSSVRKYAVLVKIFDPPETLKPGMNASVFIQTKYQSDALMVPIQSIYGVQERQFCLVYNGDDYVTREIQVGGNNSQMALILEGLEEGEEVVMNPGANKELMDLPEVKLDKRIEISADQLADAKKESKQAEKEQKPAGGFGGGGAPSADMIAGFVMQRSDKNSDGKLDKDEIAGLDSRSKSSLSKADTNGDGDISKEEVVEAMKKVMKARGSRGGGGRPGNAR